MQKLSRMLRLGAGAIALAFGLMLSHTAQAQEVTGKIEWSAWIDRDGCMHWWSDGGLEGYMVPRRNPKTGKPVCLKQALCAVENADQLFASDSAKLTADGRRRLEDFFRSAGAFGYAIYGHTDARGSSDYNMKLSERRAAAVGDVARSVGASVERQIGYGEQEPLATNKTSAGRAQNRRVEIVCYRW